MINKIRTDVTNRVSDNFVNNVVSDANKKNTISQANNSVEELELSVNGNEDFSNNITEKTVLDAIEKNFDSNRKITQDMNNQVYDALRDKINQYILNNGGDF